MSGGITLYYSPQSFFSQKARLYLREKAVKFSEHEIQLLSSAHLQPEYLQLNPRGEVPTIKHGDVIVPDSAQIYLYGEESLPGISLLPPDQREDILKMHKLIHDAPIELVTYGVMVYPELAENSHMPEFARKKMRDIALNGTNSEVVRQLLKTSPEDFVSVYEAKLEKYETKKATLLDRSKVEEALSQVENILDKVEAHLSKKQEDLNNADDSAACFLFGRDLTIADIDLSILLARLRFVGLQQRFFPPSSPTSTTNTAAAGDYTSIERPNLCRYLVQFDNRPSFRECVLQPYSTANMLAYVAKHNMVRNRGWIITGVAAVVIAGLAVYWYRKRALR